MVPVSVYIITVVLFAGAIILISREQTKLIQAVTEYTDSIHGLVSELEIVLGEVADTLHNVGASLPD